MRDATRCTRNVRECSRMWRPSVGGFVTRFLFRRVQEIKFRGFERNLDRAKAGADNFFSSPEASMS